MCLRFVFLLITRVISWLRLSSVVVPGVLGENRPQVPFAEDQHPVGEFGPGGEDEPFGMSVRARTAEWDLRCRDADAGQSRVEGVGKLPGAVADQEPEVRGPVTESMSKLRICWVVHGPSGWAVTPRMCT